MTRSRPRRLGVLAAAAAVPVALLLGLTGPANAANIDADAPTTLTIHKYAGNEGAPGDGSELADTSGLGTPLAGVEFTVTPVTAGPDGAIDLTTPAGWDRVQGATPAAVRGAGYTLGTPTVVTTGADGVVTTPLPRALYLVEETGAGGNNIVSPVAPFLVTLPLPGGDGAWTYDVHVYPKNQLNETEPTKTVADPGSLQLGAPVSWTIEAPVPALNRGETYEQFRISDELDDRLSFVSARLTNPGFAEGTHYTVQASGQTVRIDLTRAGLDLLEAGDTVSAVVTTTVDSLGGDGVIDNQAVVTTNGSSVSTGQPTTNWGPMRILKHVTGDTSKTLAGAEFEVYADAAGETLVGTLTTGEDGTAAMSLFVGSNDVTERSYWVKETVAPTGYVLDDQLREVVVQAGGETAVTEIAVPNAQQDGFELPLTGANTQLALIIAGAAMLLIAIGAAATIAARRRQRG